MAILFTEAFRASNVIKWELDPKFSRAGVVVTGQATVLPAGTVLAKQVGGDYAIAAAGDVDLAVVVMEQAGSTSIYAAVTNHAIVSRTGLIFDAGLTPVEVAALVAELEKQFVKVEASA